RADGLGFDALRLWVHGDLQHAGLPGSPRQRSAQQGADLGQRMAHALAAGLREHQAVILIGSDAPTLPAALLVRARSELAQGSHLVFGPSADGGYYLIGARGVVPPVFEGVPWSSPQTLSESLRRARDAALQVSL